MLHATCETVVGMLVAVGLCLPHQEAHNTPWTLAGKATPLRDLVGCFAPWCQKYATERNGSCICILDLDLHSFICFCFISFFLFFLRLVSKLLFSCLLTFVYLYIFLNNQAQKFLIALYLQVCLYLVLWEFDVFHTFFKCISDLTHFALN